MSDKIIFSKLDLLVEKINWYKQYVNSDFQIPSASEDIIYFSQKNIDLFNNVETLITLFENYQKSVDNRDFSYSQEQKKFKYLQIAVMLKYIGFY